LKPYLECRTALVSTTMSYCPAAMKSIKIMTTPRRSFVVSINEAFRHFKIHLVHGTRNTIKQIVSKNLRNTEGLHNSPCRAAVTVRGQARHKPWASEHVKRFKHFFLYLTGKALSYQLLFVSFPRRKSGRKQSLPLLCVSLAKRLCQ